MLLWENFSKEKKNYFFLFYFRIFLGSGSTGLSVWSLQVLSHLPGFSPGTPVSSLSSKTCVWGKGGNWPTRIVLGLNVCVWIVAFPRWSCDELIQGGMGSSRTCPRPHHHSHNPTREKQLDGWTHTHIYQYVCFCVLCRADYFMDYGCQRNKRMNKFYSISASCVTMALWFRKLSR